MIDVTAQRLAYPHDGTELVGYLVTAADGAPRPGILLIHDALGVSEPMKSLAGRIAQLGYAVLLADLWGEGRTPGGEEEIGPLIGQMASDRALWNGRIKAGHQTLLAQDAVTDGPVTAVGYCFGGASVLEYVRLGGTVDGAVSVHGGLDLVDTEDWSAANPDAAVLVLTGAEDPMAPLEVVNALQRRLTQAGVDWEVATYGATKHGFTNPHADRAGRPEAIAYNARAAARAWNALAQFAQERLQERAHMPEAAVDPAVAKALSAVCTATISQQLRGRGINHAYFDGLTAARPDLRMVGVARTLRYTALREDVFAQRGGGMNVQKTVIDTINPGEVLVIEARQDHGAGTIGDILAARLQQRGGVGVVTDGAVRDDAALKGLDLPYYRGAVNAAVLGRRHVPMDCDLPITCAGVLVMPGDVIVGDADGVMVVPAALAAEVAMAAVQQEHEEQYIAERVAAGDSINGLYPLGPEQRQRYEAWAKEVIR